MKEHPILFSGPMVRAILEGRKTQTRRIVNPQPEENKEFSPDEYWWPSNQALTMLSIRDMPAFCPKGVKGDRLWVRENFYVFPDSWDRDRGPQPIQYMADEGNDAPDFGGIGKPSIHMPRWASRILLEVTDVRVQRLKDISEEDACEEGVVSKAEWRKGLGDPIASFKLLWDSINADRAPWDSNPWCWCVTFKRLKP